MWPGRQRAVDDTVHLPASYGGAITHQAIDVGCCRRSPARAGPRVPIHRLPSTPHAVRHGCREGGTNGRTGDSMFPRSSRPIQLLPAAVSRRPWPADSEVQLQALRVQASERTQLVPVPIWAHTGGRRPTLPGQARGRATPEAGRRSPPDPPRRPVSSELGPGLPCAGQWDDGDPGHTFLYTLELSALNRKWHGFRPSSPEPGAGGVPSLRSGMGWGQSCSSVRPRGPWLPGFLRPGRTRGDSFAPQHEALPRLPRSL